MDLDNLTPLLADLDGVLGALLPLLVFIVIWVVSQFMGNRPERQVGRPAGRPRPVPPPEANPPAGEADLRKEIEAFLKQAVKPRREGPERVEVLVRKQRQRPRPARVEATIEPEVVHEATVVDQPLRESFTARVSQNLDTADFQKRAAQLGEVVGLADDKLEARLHTTFDHQVGSLSQPLNIQTDAEKSGETIRREARQASPAVAKIVAMFRSRDDIRHAILMQEILRRPKW